jgi:hypothetical protein
VGEVSVNLGYLPNLTIARVPTRSLAPAVVSAAARRRLHCTLALILADAQRLTKARATGKPHLDQQRCREHEYQCYVEDSQ